MTDVAMTDTTSVAQRDKSYPRISVSIVAYNSAPEIEGVLCALRKSTAFGEMAVFVVDNASKDQTVSLIREKFPWVKLLTSDNNMGFGRGHNQVISKVQSDYHLILNPDISFSPETIENAVGFMDKHPDIVVVTPCVLNTDGSIQYLPKKNPSWKYLLGGMFENLSGHFKRFREEYTMKDANVSSPVDVEFCTGCCMFARTAALQEVGGFDERYFLHFEDADLTRELRRLGRAVYNPEIRVTHKWHRENKKFNKSFFVALKSMVTYMAKWQGKRR